MASVVINTRFNNRKAEADLKELQAKAKETAREINAVEKGLGSATTKRNKLRDDLEAARQKAAETVAALDEVNARLDAGRKSKFGVTSKGDETLSDKLAAKLQQQDTAVQAAADAYHAQDAAVQALQQRHAELTAQLAQEKDEATRQAEAVTNAAQAAQAAQVDVSNVQRAANAMDAFVSKLFNAASVSKILKRSLSAIGSIGGKAFDFVKSKAQSVQERLAQAAQSTEHFRKRLAGLVSGALVFNVLSSGLRTLTNWMGTALLSSSGLRTALGNLQGAAATAAAPIIQILTPALTALANAAAMVFSYIARLVAFFTGRTISASAGAAKAMNGVGSAAGSAAKKVKNANGELAAFDELNVLNKQSDDSSGGGGGGADSITPDFDFSAENPFLDSIMDAIEQGDWYKVGQLIGEKLRDSLNAIGAVVDCSRGEIIRIVPAPQRASGLIGTDRRLQDGSKVTLLALVTAVSVTAHRYIPGEASEELYKDTLEPGTYRVTFDAPAVADSLAVRGAELSERGVNHCTLTVSKAAEVCVTGRKYSDSATVLRREASNLPSNAQGNEVSVPDATLVSPDRAAAVAARVLDYYAQRYEQTFRMVAGDEKLADRLIVESFGGEMVRGVVTKLEFDLTGGFLADAKIVGRKLSNNAAAYAGEEIHAGERSFI